MVVFSMHEFMSFLVWTWELWKIMPEINKYNSSSFVCVALQRHYSYSFIINCAVLPFWNSQWHQNCFVSHCAKISLKREAQLVHHTHLNGAVSPPLRSFSSSRYWSGRFAEAVHSQDEFRQGLGARLPPPKHQGDAVLDRDPSAQSSTVTGWGSAHHAHSRPTAPGLRHLLLQHHPETHSDGRTSFLSQLPRTERPEKQLWHWSLHQQEVWSRPLLLNQTHSTWMTVKWADILETHFFMYTLFV